MDEVTVIALGAGSVSFAIVALILLYGVMVRKTIKKHILRYEDVKSHFKR